ncbi:hypothetical protein ACF1HU_30680 [Streptomyces olivaceus]
MTTNSCFVRPLHRLRPDEPGRVVRAAAAAAHDRRAVRAAYAAIAAYAV